MVRNRTNAYVSLLTVEGKQPTGKQLTGKRERLTRTGWLRIFWIHDVTRTTSVTALVDAPRLGMRKERG